MFREFLNEFKNIISHKYLLIGVILLMIFGITLGYLSADLMRKVNDFRSSSIVEKAKLGAVSNIDGEVTNKNTKMIFKRVYLRCNEILTEEVVNDIRYISKNEEQIIEMYPNWEIEEFNSDKVIIQKKIDSYSPNYYKIGVMEQDEVKYIAVYNFDIDGREKIEYITSSPLDLLSEEERFKIVNGIYCNDKEGLYNLLENYEE